MPKASLEKTKMPEAFNSQGPPGQQGFPPLSRLEMTCMKAIWLQNATTVSQVQRCLQPRRPLAYTTILTILDRLVRKGALTRIKQGKAYTYRPQLTFEESRRKAVAELVEFYFEDTPAKLQQFLSAGPLSQPPPLPAEPAERDLSEINVCLL